MNAHGGHEVEDLELGFDRRIHHRWALQAIAQSLVLKLDSRVAAEQGLVGLVPVELVDAHLRSICRPLLGDLLWQGRARVVA